MREEIFIEGCYDDLIWKRKDKWRTFKMYGSEFSLIKEILVPGNVAI